MTAPRARTAGSLSTVSPRTVRSAAPQRASTEERRASVLHGDMPIDAQAREGMIREAAYFHAERRGFTAGHELEDWLAAEDQIETWLATRAAPRRYGP